MDRELSGIYFRIPRNDKWENVDITDMTEEQIRKALDGKSKEFLLGLCMQLAFVVKDMGNRFRITCVPIK